MGPEKFETEKKILNRRDENNRKKLNLQFLEDNPSDCFGLCLLLLQRTTMMAAMMILMQKFFVRNNLQQ